MSGSVPPFARWILRLVAEREHRDEVVEDLAEEAAVRERSGDPADARRWMRRQVLASVGPLFIRRLQSALTRHRSTHMGAWRGFSSDLTAAVRRLREAPGFTLVCVLTLALGIGGNTAVFTLIDRVVLKPLPVARPSELFRVGNTDQCCVISGFQGSFSLFSYDLYQQLRAAAPQFTDLAAFQAHSQAVTIGRPDNDAPPETLNGAFVSGNYFQLFELVPAAGRLLRPSDDERGAAAVAVISHAAWVTRFAGRSDIVGRPVTLNGVPATIVGVAAAGFYGETLRPNPPELWVPLSTEPQLQPAARLVESPPQHWLYVMGRLPRGTAIPPIEAQLTATLRHWLGSIDLSREPGGIDQQHIAVIAASAGVTSMRDVVAPTLRLLQLLAAAVLLIACANLASLLLARGTARRTETAVRVAIGASRGRLVGQFLLESVLLACAGGLAGLVVAVAGARTIVALAFRGATDIPVDPSPSPEVIAFAVGASLLTGAIFGAAPAIVGSRTDPIDALRGASRAAGDRGSRVRGSLIALQVSLSLVLIMCAGLLVRSLRSLEGQDFGVAVNNRYVVGLSPSLTTAAPDELPAMYRRIRERLREIPGVVNAGFSLYAPMSGDNWSTRIVVEGASSSDRVFTSWNRVSAGYFEAVGTPILRGRTFDERDGPGAPLVAIVTESFARTFLGDADPIGRRIGPSGPQIQIVGVVGDAKYQDGRDAPRETFFMPFLQQTPESRARAVQTGMRIDRSQYPQAIEIQTAGAVTAIERDVRQALAQVDRRLTVDSVVAMEEQVARAFNIERLIARLAVAFGGVALLLACLGLYGVTAYSVARRTREIGIRMAVGASRSRVVGTVLRSAVVSVMAGVALGLLAAFWAGRLLQARLFGVSAHDPVVLGAGLVLLIVSVGVAALLPASRAASLDPVGALRME